MIYVFDTSSFIVLGHYFPDRFPSFWVNLESLVANGRAVSVSEVQHELSLQVTKEHLANWIEKRKDLFSTPSSEETQFVSGIFEVASFQQLLRRKNILEGTPVADPWVIARAATSGGCVVTEEKKKRNAVRIPSVCEHFDVDCTSLEGLMEREGWQF